MCSLPLGAIRMSLNQSRLISRIAGLRRLRQLGVHLPGPKQEAVMRADTTNTVVHPFFVFSVTGHGVHFVANPTNLLQIARWHSKYGQLSFEQTEDIAKGNDPNLKAQAYIIIVSGAIRGRFFDFGRSPWRYLR